MSDIELKADPIASLNTVLQQTLVKAITERTLDEIDLWVLVFKENLQNAIDAIRIRRLEEGTPMYVADGRRVIVGIDVYDKISKAVFYIEDQGIGMDEKIIREKFATLFSSTKRLLRERVREEEATFLLGGFGVGFWTTSMLAEKILVVSKKDDSLIYLSITPVGNDVILEDYRAMVRPIEDIKISKITYLEARKIAEEFGIEERLDSFLKRVKREPSGTLVAYNISEKRVAFAIDKKGKYEFRQKLGRSILRGLLCVRPDITLEFISRVLFANEIHTYAISFDPSKPAECRLKTYRSSGIYHVNYSSNLPFRVRELLRFIFESKVKYSDLLFGKGKSRTTKLMVYELRDFSDKVIKMFVEAGYQPDTPRDFPVLDTLIDLTHLFEEERVIVMNDLIVESIRSYTKKLYKEEVPIFIIIESSGVPLSLGRTMISNKSIKEQMNYLFYIIEFAGNLDVVGLSIEKLGLAVDLFLYLIGHLINKVSLPSGFSANVVIGSALLYLKKKGINLMTLSFTDITHYNRRIANLSATPWSIIDPKYAVLLTNAFQHGEYIFISKKDKFFSRIHEAIVVDNFCRDYKRFEAFREWVHKSDYLFSPMYRILFPNDESINTQGILEFFCSFLNPIAKKYVKESELLEKAKMGRGEGWVILTREDIEEGRVQIPRGVLLAKELIMKIINSARFRDILWRIIALIKQSLGVSTRIKEINISIGINPDEDVIMGVLPKFMGLKEGVLEISLDISINANAYWFKAGMELDQEKLIDAFAHELGHIVDFVMESMGITEAVHTAEMEELTSKIKGEMRSIVRESLASLLLRTEFPKTPKKLLLDLEYINKEITAIDNLYRGVLLPKGVAEATVKRIAEGTYFPSMFIDDNGTLYLSIGEGSYFSTDRKVLVSINYSTKETGGFPIRFTFRIIRENGDIYVLNSIGSVFLFAKKEGFSKYVDPIIASISLPKTSLFPVLRKDIRDKFLIIRGLCDPQPLLEAKVKMIGMPLMKTVIVFT